MELIAILAVIVVGAAGLLGYRYYIERRDAAFTATTGGEWRIRTHLPIDPGPPFCYFAGLRWGEAHEVMEGVEDGFEVAYFTMGEGNVSGSPIERPAAIVQLPFAAPAFRYDASGTIGGLAAVEALRTRHGSHGGIGPRTAEALALRGDVAVESVGYAVLIRSKGARPEVVARFALHLAKAMAADNA